MSFTADQGLLLVLHRYTDGDNWHKKTNWGTDAPLSTWHGVEVNGEGRVVKLALGSNNLRGPIPAKLEGLSELRELNLSDNKLTGPIPKKLGSLHRLRKISLEGNLLSGHIPQELGSLPELQRLHLQRNNLSGPIPEQLAHLRKLQRLTLEDNQLSGSFPDKLLAQLMRHGFMCLPSVRQESGIADDSIPHIVAEEKADGVEDVVLPQVTLASSLGPDPAVYVSTSHGVEFETQAGSLSAGSKVHGPVTVSPCLQIVEFPVEGSGRAPSDGEDIKEEFLITAVIGGPEEVSFRQEKPAKLRFFVGYVDEFASELDLMDDEDIKKYVLETYRPLTSPDGKGNWTDMQPLSVLFPPLSVDGKRRVWAETAIRHFSFKALAKKTAKKIARKTLKLARTAFGLRTKSPYIYGPWIPSRTTLGGGGSRKRMVRFGNDTKHYAVFVYYPTVTFTKVEGKSGFKAEVAALGVGVGGEMHKEIAVEGHEHTAAREPIMVIVKPGTYSDHELHAGLNEHKQLDLVIGVLKDLEEDNPDKAGKLQLLEKRKISGSKELIIRKQAVSGPFAYEAINWKCTTRDILEAVHPADPAVEEAQFPVAAPPLNTGPMPPPQQRNIFQRMLPGIVGTSVAVAVSTVAAPAVAVVAGVGAIAWWVPDDEDDD